MSAARLNPVDRWPFAMGFAVIGIIPITFFYVNAMDYRIASSDIFKMYAYAYPYATAFVLCIFLINYPRKKDSPFLLGIKLGLFIFTAFVILLVGLITAYAIFRVALVFIEACFEFFFGFLF